MTDRGNRRTLKCRVGVKKKREVRILEVYIRILETDKLYYIILH